MITLWVASAYQLKNGKYRFGSLITAFPAAFMTAVTVTYILTADEGFKMNQTISVIVGLAFAAVVFIMYLFMLIRRCRNKAEPEKAAAG